MITVVIYPAGGVLTRKKWRFSIRGANNEIIATSGKQSYYNRADLMSTLRLILDSDVPARWRDSDGTEGEWLR